MSSRPSSTMRPLLKKARHSGRWRYRVYEDCKNMADVAMEIIEEQGILRNVPENIARYFDYEAYGRGLETKGAFIYIPGGKYLEIL